MSTSYQADIIDWANEQAHYIRTGQFQKLDIEHLADEIEDVAKAEKREFAHRVAALMELFIRWQYQPGFRSAQLSVLIARHRKAIAHHLNSTPSIKQLLLEKEWVGDMWSEAMISTHREEKFDITLLPETCPWSIADVLTDSWFPD